MQREDFCNYQILESLLHHTSERFDSPPQNAVARFDSPVHNAAEGFDSPLHNAAERFDSPLHDAQTLIPITPRIWKQMRNESGSKVGTLDEEKKRR